MYQALYRKWRPRCFDDVVGQVHITETLKRQVETDRLSHAYLFTGTRGTGKTSCAKILARAVNCEHPQHGNPCNQCPSCLGIESGSILDVLELDAASNNGVDQVRALRDEAVYTPASVKKRVYIIDEVHMLSTSAFNALLKILEEPPAHLLFILATTELHKVPATIKSRCQQYSFKRIQADEIVKQLLLIADREEITLSMEGARLLARLADGGLRDALSLLDQCIGSGSTLQEADILAVLGLAGNIEISNLMDCIIRQDTATAMERIGTLYQDGKDMGALLGELTTLVRDLLIRKTATKAGDALLTGNYKEAVLQSFTEQLSASELVEMLSILQTASAELFRSSNRRTDVELCIIRLCEKKLSTIPESLLARISRLEEQMSTGVLRSDVPKTPEVKTSQNAKTDAPPWDNSPLVSKEEQRSQTIPAENREKPPISASKKSPSPTTVREKPENDWKHFVTGLRGKILPSAYPFLKQTIGVFEEQHLKLYVDSDMTKALLGKQEVVSALEQEAKAYTGQTISVQIQIGKPEAKTQVKPEHSQEDKLSDLLKLGEQFGNITIK